MSETPESLHRKMEGAKELGSVVRTMKAIAASQISQYERAVQSLGDYYQTVEMGLRAACRLSAFATHAGVRQRGEARTHAVVFGSDQGLVGQFNEVIAGFAAEALERLSGEKVIWAVGERVTGHLNDLGLETEGSFQLPNSVSAITPLIGQILVESEALKAEDGIHSLYLFHNRPEPGATYSQASQRLLPLDELFLADFSRKPWPTNNLPEVLGQNELTLQTLIEEYLFVSLFKACAESLASENSSRLSAMQRAEKNIDELLNDLTRSFHHLRQTTIDEELFDLVSGFEALKHDSHGQSAMGIMQGAKMIRSSD